MNAGASSNLHHFVQTAGSALYDCLTLQSMRMTVRNPHTGEIAQFIGNRPSGEPERAMISQTLLLEGRPVGFIELHSASTAVRPSELLLAVQRLNDELAVRLDPPSR